MTLAPSPAHPDMLDCASDHAVQLQQRFDAGMPLSTSDLQVLALVRHINHLNQVLVDNGVSDAPQDHVHQWDETSVSDVGVESELLVMRVRNTTTVFRCRVCNAELVTQTSGRTGRRP